MVFKLSRSCFSSSVTKLEGSGESLVRESRLGLHLCRRNGIGISFGSFSLERLEGRLRKSFGVRPGCQCLNC